MSKYSKIKKQHEDFVAAHEAIEKTRPEAVIIAYRNTGIEPGYLSYEPGSSHIRLHDHNRYEKSSVSIEVDDIPALIKALRDFVE